VKQLKIANFFGIKAQQLKADEELDEINEAFEIYINDQNKENLKNLLMEVYDLSNVIEGLYIQMGGCMREVQAEKEYKLYRTIQIIKKIPKDCINKLDAYEGIRKED
jgi:ribonucleotide reductase beta subunit family protein with ferritin-like domain